MTTTVTIYHNPNCSKSRQALAYLQNADSDLNIHVVEYLQTPPNQQTLSELVRLSGQPLSDFIRTNEDIYQSLNLATLDNQAEIIAQIIKHPILIQRPIVVVGEQVIIARPPERVYDILPKASA